jgi:hypothetical protein
MQNYTLLKGERSLQRTAAHTFRTPIPAPDFAGAPPFYYCGFIQQPTSKETGKRLAKFLCGLLPSPQPSPTGRGRKDRHKKTGQLPGF